MGEVGALRNSLRNAVIKGIHVSGFRTSIVKLSNCKSNEGNEEEERNYDNWTKTQATI